MFNSWAFSAPADDKARKESTGASASALVVADSDESTHRKRLAQILRYIANMHQQSSIDGGGGAGVAGCSFVRPIAPASNRRVSPFFYREIVNNTVDGNRGSGVLFTTENFRQLRSLAVDDEPPFSFYAATKAQSFGRKRSLTGALKEDVRGSDSDNHQGACWFRISRTASQALTPPPDATDPDVLLYLDQWLAQTPQAQSTRDLLFSYERLEQAPKVSPTVSAQGTQEIKSLLRKHKKYVRKLTYQQKLEPIYNRLFEWVQSQEESDNYELVWGMGHASQMLRTMDADAGTGVCSLVNGPVLEVQVEVALDTDGTILVRPREHTGVTLNRQVVSAIRSSANDQSVLQNLHRVVSEIEAYDLCPGEPTTYIPLLKRIAVQLSSAGTFQSSNGVAYNPSASLSAATDVPSKLIVTEAWCLFARPRPSSVWARDATAFADQLMKNMGETSSASEIPRATKAFTCGPSGGMEPKESPSRMGHGVLKWVQSQFLSKQDDAPEVQKPMFPLPSSDAQNRIAELLLTKQFPAVVCEGPPGCGKTQAIANTLCAYLCQGKRVLVTSKNASALSVLRSRLPLAVQDLCVDLSMSESTGVRQLQLTVERLSNRLTSSNCEMNQQKCLYLQRSIQQHEKELGEIDQAICQQSEQIRHLLQTPDGQEFMEQSLELREEVPWLMATIESWSLDEISALCDRVATLMLNARDPALEVSGFPEPPSDALVSLVASKAGYHASKISNAAKMAIATIPVVGAFSGMQQHTSKLRETMSELRLGGKRNVPTTSNHWSIVLRALTKARAVHAFVEDVWKVYQQRDAWPEATLLSCNNRVQWLHANLEKAVQAKRTARKLNVEQMIGVAARCQSLDAKRSMLASRIQSLAEELVNATVLAELSQSFSDEAHSALIRFSQIAGKAKMNKAVIAKLSNRQRRLRQDYLDAFEKCCRFIPCWILKSSSTCDYLPPEFSLFDLVINDESSLSDVTVLPGMLRGKQWLIVGDGKQVSPTEAFVSEDQMESLRAARSLLVL